MDKFKSKKLNIERHKDYTPKEFLPTFNSRVIELNFHRIKSLSNKFVYFNDDMFILKFILKKVKEKDFFQNNMPCDSLIFDALQANSDTFNSTLYDNMVIIKKIL